MNRAADATFPLFAPGRRDRDPGQQRPEAFQPGIDEASAVDTRSEDEILRFRRSEREMHWAIALPFMICFASAAVLLVVYNPDPSRPYRSLVSWIHRLSGVSLIVLPILALLRDPRDLRVHLQNVRLAWSWARDDVRWLLLTGLAAMSRRVSLPEEGKFNAGEKLNFMMVTLAVPLFIVTGLLIWMPGVSFVSWLLHTSLALAVVPLMFGHLFMALVNPATRVGLSGMVSGLVDRTWARHHYRRWYRETFEAELPEDVPQPAPAPVVAMIADDTAAGRSEPARSRGTVLRCLACSQEHPMTVTAGLVRAIYEGSPTPCPGCGHELEAITLVAEAGGLERMLAELDDGAVAAGPASVTTEATVRRAPVAPQPVGSLTALGAAATAAPRRRAQRAPVTPAEPRPPRPSTAIADDPWSMRSIPIAASSAPGLHDPLGAFAAGPAGGGVANRAGAQPRPHPASAWRSIPLATSRASAAAAPRTAAGRSLAQRPAPRRLPFDPIDDWATRRR